MASLQLFTCHDRMTSILAKKKTVWLELIFWYWIFYFEAYAASR